MIHRGNAGSLRSDRDEQSLEQAAVLLFNLNQIPDMDEVAESCGISRTLFYAKFRRQFGMSPRTYREQHAFRVAQSLLENTDYTLERIAQEIGFVDPFYFSRRFKILYGMSPSEYRKRLSDGNIKE